MLFNLPDDIIYLICQYAVIPGKYYYNRYYPILIICSLSNYFHMISNRIIKFDYYHDLITSKLLYKFTEGIMFMSNAK